MKKYPRIAVRAIIVDNKEKILLLKRALTEFASGIWCLPGGKIEFGETIETALKSEIKEETGLEITSYSFFTHLNNLPEKTGDPHFVTIIFKCKTRGNLKINNESSDFRWIGREDIENYEFAFGNKKVVEEYFLMGNK